MAAAVGRVVTDDGAWDQVDATDLVGFTVDPGFRVVVTYKRVRGQWQPWTLVTQSAALKEKGIPGRGLYTLQPLISPRKTAIGQTKATRVGRYTGTVIAAFLNIEAPEARALIEEQRRDRDELPCFLCRLRASPGGPSWTATRQPLLRSCRGQMISVAFAQRPTCDLQPQATWSVSSTCLPRICR